MSRSLLGLTAVAGFGLAVLFFLLATLLSPNLYRPFGGFGFGDSKSATRTLAWGGGDWLELATSANVTLVPGGAPGVTLRGDQNAIETVTLSNGRLSGGNSYRCPVFIICGESPALTVELHGVTLREIHVQGSGDVALGKISQDRLDIQIDGSGDVSGSGQVDALSVHIAGSGDGNLYELASKSLVADIEGSGDVRAGATEHAKISIFGSGDVHLAGAMPEDTTAHISGSGTVTDSEGRRITRRSQNRMRQS